MGNRPLSSTDPDEFFNMKHSMVDPFAHLLRYKSFPYYSSWCDIFGNDKATGEHAKDIFHATKQQFGLEYEESKARNLVWDAVDIIPGKAVKSVTPKLTISKSSSSSTKSVGVTTRSMLKKLEESSQISPLAEHVEKNLHSPSYTSESDANKSPSSSPRFVSSYSFTTNMALVMIARLINKADNVDASHVMGKQVETHDKVEASAKQHYIEKNKYAKKLQISFDGLIPVDQLKEFIEGTIRSKIEGSSKSSLTYSKPYTPRIDSLKMPMSYQPPKFQQFDGKGNSKQYAAHFVETCNNAGTYGDHLVKQFVRSLKGNAFDWYTDLEVGSIYGWEQLQ
ncbi:hypothetical protein Sango_2919900 [Sesamum angolense]|uniref:Ty3-gypsy retrotransposon protein n=1 Tax=Sesamum angolense TaxID=2727404 RepID=A0AAE1T471_9LAMI|nr:hypothetical protein Sango_2919900 [Sesamum angolense]